MKTKVRLYTAYPLPHLTYCSITWHFCGRRNSDKLEKLNYRALRLIIQYQQGTYETYDELLQRINQSARFFKKNFVNDIYITFTIRTNNTYNTLEYKREKKPVTFPTMTCKKKVALNPTKQKEK